MLEAKNLLEEVRDDIACRLYDEEKDVPIVGTVENFDEYDTVFVGFPIWYWSAPNVVNTFCKAYSWSRKKVYVFATSGSSGIGKTAEKLQNYISDAKIVDARRVESASELADWMRHE